MTRIRNILLPVAGIFWLILSTISFLHFFEIWQFPSITTSLIGILGWICFTVTIAALAANELKSVVFVFVVFFLAGCMAGPFLEPPGDPLDHLRITHTYCGKGLDDIQSKNKGLLQYSMNGMLVCPARSSGNPEIVLKAINGLNGLYWGGAASILYLVGSAAGLSFRWSLFSVLVAFLFMGTNRFSYFSYYSFAPSFSSLWLYWLWIAFFFFKKDMKCLWSGLVTAVLILPVILVNHIQEAVFLGLLVGIWLLLNFHERIWAVFSGKSIHDFRLGMFSVSRRSLRYGYLLVLIGIFFILPQSEDFRKILARMFIYDNWKLNQQAVYYWDGLHIMGKIWGFRVRDTLGFFGILPVFLIPFLVWRHAGNKQDGWIRTRVIVLGILPLLVYCTPLLHYIWLSNCERVPSHIRYYYRICYSSLFWLPIALFCSMVCEYYLPEKIGARGADIMRGLIGKMSRVWGRSYYGICFVIVVLLSTVRTGPIYGKLDFILLDSKVWWKQWKPMIRDMFADQHQNIYTDQTTHNVLHDVFNLPTRVLRTNGRPFRVSDVQWLDKIGRRKNADCLVNLHSYPSSWVPRETGHWSSEYSDTASYYSYNDLQGDRLKSFLKKNPLQNCSVYY